MGGSGIAGALIKAIADHYRFLPIELIDGPIIPPWYGKETLFVFCSYSGNTWEVLAAYQQCVPAGCHAVVLSSGGALIASAVRDAVPLIALPGGGVPRDMLAYMLGALLGVLAHLKYNTAPLVASLCEHWQEHGLAIMNEQACQQALAHIGDAESCHVWGVRGDTDVLAYRTQTQLNENSKMIAVTSILPELNHNLVVGFTATSCHAPIILLMTAYGDARLQCATQSLVEVLAGRGITLYKPPLLGDNWLHQVASGLWWADSVSHRIGYARGHARAATVLIDQLKQTFSKKVATHEETASS